MRLCVIPARGGSKRIPRKNLRAFFGRPIIDYSIRAAIESGIFDKVIVSTEDSEIGDVAVRLGAEVPFMRPKDLSDDYATTSQVMSHAVSWYFDRGLAPEHICCLYATAPFVQAESLRRSFELLVSTGAPYVFSVTKFPFPIQRAIRLNSLGQVEPMFPQFQFSRSQDLEPSWHDAGQFYWGTSEAWRSSLPIFSAGAFAYQLPGHLVQDIDTPEDWERAEILFRAWKSGE